MNDNQNNDLFDNDAPTPTPDQTPLSSGAQVYTPPPSSAYTPPPPPSAPYVPSALPPAKKSNRTVWIIVGVVALVLICCCCIGVGATSLPWEDILSESSQYMQ